MAAGSILAKVGVFLSDRLGVRGKREFSVEIQAYILRSRDLVTSKNLPGVGDSLLLDPARTDIGCRRSSSWSKIHSLPRGTGTPLVPE